MSALESPGRDTPVVRDRRRRGLIMEKRKYEHKDEIDSGRNTNKTSHTGRSLDRMVPVVAGILKTALPVL